jgi:UDP-N-acetylmuramate--alanine ligase
VGIGGAGMSGIAELLANLGYQVTGSDLKRSDVTARLERLGIGVFERHEGWHVGDADVVVFSSAVRTTNPEIIEAERRRIPVIPRAEMLAELMRLRYSIAIAGAHGKTTTTSMIAVALERGGVDPTAVIGGRVSVFGGNARIGRGEYMVVEADESDASFLKLSPTIAVLTNVDYEHLETYGDFDHLCQAFVDFANKVPFYGAIVACLDDDRLKPLLPRMRRRVITYALDNADADIFATDVTLSGFNASCRVQQRLRQAGGGASGEQRLGDLRLRVPGRHNLQNALAAVAVASEIGVRFEHVAEALADFHGAERRFQVHGEVDNVLVVEDYGHHPSEIEAVVRTARAAVPRRLLVAFQPHRYSRTQALLDRFGPALAGADELVLTDIYAAGEEVVPGVTVDTLADAIRRAAPSLPVHIVHAVEDVPAALARLAHPGDLVVLLGAGSIGAMAPRVIAALERRQA